MSNSMNWDRHAHYQSEHKQNENWFKQSWNSEFSRLNRKLNKNTHPNAKGRLFPVPNGTVAIGGGWGNLRSDTTPRSQLAVPSPPATWFSRILLETE